MSGPGAIVAFCALVAAVAYGIGHELGDGGSSAALFLLLAAGGVFVSLNMLVAGAPAALLPVVFGSGPALIAAGFAYAGGRRKEERCR